MMQPQQTQTIGIAFVQRRPNVFDVSPTFYKCFVSTEAVGGSWIYVMTTFVTMTESQTTNVLCLIPNTLGVLTLHHRDAGPTLKRHWVNALCYN